MKKLFSVILLLSMVGCAPSNITNKETPILTPSTQKEVNNQMIAEIQTLEQAEAKKNLDENKDIILLDVRTVEEYAEKHIPGSILIPLDEITEDRLAEMIPSKDSTVYIYCRSGNRSRSAYNIISSTGYANIYDIGGINTWKYETE